MSGAGRKLEGVAVALPYLVTFRSRMLVRKSQEGAVAASDKVRFQGSESHACVHELQFGAVCQCGEPKQYACLA